MGQGKMRLQTLPLAPPCWAASSAACWKGTTSDRASRREGQRRPRRVAGERPRLERRYGRLGTEIIGRAAAERLGGIAEWLKLSPGSQYCGLRHPKPVAGSVRKLNFGGNRLTWH
jgi:hypothetical protein